MNIILKRCFRCGEEKDITTFAKSVASKSGYQNACKSCRALMQKTYRKNNTARARAISLKSDLKRKYGMTPDGWQKMFDAQEGRCKICQRHQSEFKTTLCVDHNHETGEIRGLLCPSCNHRLIAFDDKVFCARATLYLGGLL